MTIPAGFIWCPVCQEACHDHSRICTVCGSTLVHPPVNVVNNNSNNNALHNPQLHAVVPDHLLQQLRESTTALQQLVHRLRTDIGQVREEQYDVLEGLRHIREELATVQHQHVDSQLRRGRPTAQTTLQTLPRILLENSSHSLFRQASLSFMSCSSSNAGGGALETMQAVPGEFGWADDAASAVLSLEEAVLVVAEPRTGQGGALSTETLQTIQALTSQATSERVSSTKDAAADSVDVILYMERGGGVTFVQKALLAQQAGAKALVVGNNQAQPWPFVMRDSSSEAASRDNKLTIPVVMVKQADGQAIVSRCRQGGTGIAQQAAVACALSILPQSKECVICTETFQVGHTVLRLPACGHVFHESCALQWLQLHNTCPYCRRELPTDDPEYEQERRRAQRTHAGSEGARSSDWNDFYR